MPWPKENAATVEPLFVQFFKRLDRHMAAPVAEDSIWRTTDANEDFEPNASAPIMRQQNVVHLTKVITDWYKKAPAAI